MSVVDFDIDPEKAGRLYRKKTLIWAVQMSAPFVVKTLEGVISGKAGDWLAKGVKGELYSIDAQIFEETYEEA